MNHKCIDNLDFIDEFVDGLGSYNEYSKSGNGIHIICKGVLPPKGRRKGNVEMYSEGRFFITTGNVYNDKYTEIVDCTERIKTLHAKYIPNLTPTVAVREFTKLEMSDNEILEKIRNSKNSTAFQR